MRQRFPILALAGICALIIGTGLYLRAGAESGGAGLPEPRVPGREIAIVDSMGVGSAWTIYCEYDARVALDGKTVVAVYSGGTSASVEIGDNVVEDMGTRDPALGAPGYMVYRGKDGLLHVGCAPESVTTIQ